MRKGFRQIVVCARVDALDPLGPGASRRQDQDRQAVPRPAPALENCEAVHPGKARVKVLRVAITVAGPDEIREAGMRRADHAPDEAEGDEAEDRIAGGEVNALSTRRR